MMGNLNREIVWILPYRRPEEIPMSRMGEYITHLATMLGYDTSVHLSRVERGSTRLVAQPKDGKASQAARANIAAIRNGNAPAAARSAYQRIENLLCRDGGAAHLQIGSVTVLRFKGRDSDTEPARGLVDTGVVTGNLYSLSAEDSGALKARIRRDGGAGHIRCRAESRFTDKLRQNLFKNVRLRGKGIWKQTAAGEWHCDDLEIVDIWPLQTSTLQLAIESLRNIQADWKDDPLNDWREADKEDGAA